MTANNISVTRTNEKTARIHITFEITIPNEPREEQQRVLQLIGRLLGEAIQTRPERDAFLEDLRESFAASS